MTRNQFMEMCVERMIDPSIALENDNIKEALRNKDNEAVKNILDMEF